MRSRALPIVLAAGIGLGLAARLIDEFAPRWVGDIAAVWVLAAFWAGSRVDRQERGAALGVVCLVTASLVYYLWRVEIDQTISGRYLMLVGGFWTLLSIGTGVVAGALGARSRYSPGAWGLVAGAFAGEALVILSLRNRLSQVVIEFIVAALCVVPARRQLRRALALSVAVAIAFAAVSVSYRFARGSFRRSRLDLVATADFWIRT